MAAKKSKAQAKTTIDARLRAAAKVADAALLVLDTGEPDLRSLARVSGLLAESANLLNDAGRDILTLAEGRANAHV